MMTANKKQQVEVEERGGGQRQNVNNNRVPQQRNCTHTQHGQKQMYNVTK
jgi:hypothetical protein